MCIRRLNRSEAQMAIELSDRVFREKDQVSMGKAFPFIFSEAFIESSYGYFIEGKLIVFMGLVPSTICIGNARVQVYSLGSVCTHPDYRGKGYASEVLEQILKDLQESEAALLLISGDRSLYTRKGSRFFGETSVFEIEEHHKVDCIENAEIREMQQGDLHSITRCAHERRVRYEQTVTELNQLLQAEAYASCIKKQHRVLVAEVNDELKAFLVVGVPYHSDNKTGTVIEWAGDPRLLLALLKEAIEKYNLDKLQIKVPWQETQLVESLSVIPSATENNQGTMLIIDPEKLLGQLKPFFEERHVLLKYTKAEDKEGVYLEHNDGVQYLSNEALIAGLFNPHDRQLEVDFKVPLPYTAGLNYV